MRGRKPTPTRLKLLRGNPGKRRINGREPAPAPIVAPQPPAALTGPALEEWHKRAPQLARLGLLTEVDLPAFTAYCRAWGRYVRAEEKVDTMGEVVKAPGGFPIQNPYLAIANKAYEQCQKFWSSFAMTPSDRSRVHVAKAGEAAPSRLAQFIRRVK